MSRVFLVGVIGVVMVGSAAWALSGNLGLFDSSPDPDAGRTAKWPPAVGETYPDWELLNTRGEYFSLSSLRGKVVVIELIGLPCPACQAMAGGHWRGGFAGVKPQANLQSLDEAFPKYAETLRLSDPRITYVQLLLYNMDGDRLPSLEEARAWERHFAVQERSNAMVLIGNSEMLSAKTRKMIPGIHLLDHNLKLRSIAGNPPLDNVYLNLIPLAGKLVTHVESTSSLALQAE